MVTVCLIEIFIYKIPTRNITIIVAESIFVLLIPCHIYVSEFISLMIFPRIAFPEYAFNDQHSRDGKVRIALRSAS